MKKLLHRLLDWLFPAEAELAPPVEAKPARIEFYQNVHTRKWHWRMKALGNNEILCSGETNGYYNLPDLRRMLGDYFPGVPVKQIADPRC